MSDVLAGKLPVKQAPVVVANILTHILVAIFKDGMLSWSPRAGYCCFPASLKNVEGDILAALEENQLIVIDRIRLDDWLGLASKTNIFVEKI